MSFDEQLSDKIAYINKTIKGYLPKEEGFQKTIFQAMNYSVLAGGKRIRPLLMQETYRLFGGKGKEIEPLMAAIEMIHTSSLVHDDLPCMDNDEYRRGKKTTWAVFGEDMATLAGDALLLYAFEVASKAFEMSCDPQKAGRAIHILANKAGIHGMVGGQVVDIEATNTKIAKDKLLYTYRLKTGALLEASMMAGATMGGAKEEEIRAIERIAADIGLAFQIQDDILDVTSSIEILGKTTFSDEKNHKTTYVTLEGVDQAGEEVKALSRRALENLAQFSDSNHFLYQLIETLITREK